jgi:putative MFS transporter
MWIIGDKATAFEAMLLASAGRFFIGIATVSIWVYFTEIFPTRMRSIGSGSAGAWIKIASIVGPSAVGLTLETGGIGGVFLLFALTSLVGTATVFLFLVETRGKILEEIAQ